MNKLKFWLCKKCIEPIAVCMVRKSSFVETPMGKCEKCDTYWEVPSVLYDEANRILSLSEENRSKWEKNMFEEAMRSAKKSNDWERNKELWVAMMLCEKTVKSDQKIAKMLIGC